MVLHYITPTYRSPGYGVTLVSESTTGVTHSAESSTHTTPTQVEKEEKDKKPAKATPTLPEDIGRQAAMHLIEEIVKVHLHACSSGIV